MSKVQVHGFPNLYKDSETGLITQESTQDRERYRLARHNAMLQMSLQDEVAHLKKDMSVMKESLDTIINLLTINTK